MTYQTTFFMPFRLADPAQIMFFGNILDITHDLFEEFIRHIGIEWKDWFQPKDWACPIRNCQIDFRAPMKPGHTYDIQMNLSRLGETSFTMRYVFMKDSDVKAEVYIVHSFVSQPQFKKTNIPTPIRKLLQTHLVDASLEPNSTNQKSNKIDS